MKLSDALKNALGRDATGIDPAVLRALESVCAQGDEDIAEVRDQYRALRAHMDEQLAGLEGRQAKAGVQMENRLMSENRRLGRLAITSSLGVIAVIVGDIVARSI